MNAITVDSCKKLGLLFETVMASVEVVNSYAVDVQATGHIGTLAVDKCDGVEVVPDVRVQFYIPDCTHLKGHCGNGVLKCDSIIEVANLFHSGIRLPEPVNHSIPENRMGRLSSEEQALEDGILPRYIIGMIRMTCMFIMSVTSGSMLAFFVSFYCTSHNQEGILRMAMFMIPMLGVCVYTFVK
ncbi:hypothetical protein BSKO_13199 [Bryopsis sp. KO-2023]|nr:hypothetical protein BSKO_13199 [Bryopsis sp. KO-2023]